MTGCAVVISLVRPLRWILVVSVAVIHLGCGSAITAPRIEGAIAPTFTNLVRLQMTWLGLPPLSATDVGVRANCRRLLGDDAGSGEWTCVLVWQGPDRRRLRDTYELFVTTDGCYTATASVEALGGPTLKSENGREVRNLLYAFEGCFDTT
jgi:hypothetical protein